MNNMLRVDERDLDQPHTTEELTALCPNSVTGGHFSDIFRFANIGETKINKHNAAESILKIKIFFYSIVYMGKSTLKL